MKTKNLLSIFAGCCGLFAASCCVGGEETLVWSSTDVRYPYDWSGPVDESNPFPYPVWRGETANAQAFFRTDTDIKGVRAEVKNLRNGRYSIPDSCVSAHFLTYIMADVLADGHWQCGKRPKGMFDSLLVADIIDIDTVRDVPKCRMQPLWVSVDVPSDAEPGVYKGKLVLSGGVKAILPFEIEVSDRVLPPASQWKFHLDLWQNPYAIARYHNVELWSNAHFDLMRPVMEILAKAGQKVVTTTIIDRPWNGQTYDAFGSMVTRVRHKDGSWSYDYSVFDKWVEFMEEIGIDSQINCFSLIPWTLKFDYIDAGTGEMNYIQAAPGTREYRIYWSRFVADFVNHLRDKGWYEKTMIAMDERPLEAMKAALDVIRSVAPDMKVSLAGDFHAEIESELSDLCIPFRSSYPEGVIERRRSEGKITTFYTCCAESHPNMFVVSPPAEAAWLPWRALAIDCDGYLRWAYNSWPFDPLVDTRFREWPAGDCFMVYPGGRSSVRMEKLIEGIQDYEKARILRNEWIESGDNERLAALDSALSHFTEEEILEAGAEKAVAGARAVIAGHIQNCAVTND